MSSKSLQEYFGTLAQFVKNITQGKNQTEST